MMITSRINTLWSADNEFKRLKQPSQDIADQGRKVAVLHFLLVHRSDFLRQFPLNMVKVPLNFFPQILTFKRSKTFKFRLQRIRMANKVFRSSFHLCFALSLLLLFPESWNHWLTSNLLILISTYFSFSGSLVSPRPGNYLFRSWKMCFSLASV